jgi:hypothetical protein
MHKHQQRNTPGSLKEKTMTMQRSITTMACSEYQQLLEQSKHAKDIWDLRRTEICRSRLIGEETGDELLRLQAKYARAYTVLCNHVNTCLRCRPVSKIA